VNIKRFRCTGEDERDGCGGVFEVDIDVDGVLWCCPLCLATFCGAECCGNFCEELNSAYRGPGMYEPPQAWVYGVHRSP
jgi:hypothetical protein